ncbi:MAG: hypothetical protein KDC88_06685 [Ignavibacteriae bacterium]|nr:hypothetical protein [Ignavibacteriota bacterium]
MNNFLKIFLLVIISFNICLPQNTHNAEYENEQIEKDNFTNKIKPKSISEMKLVRNWKANLDYQKENFYRTSIINIKPKKPKFIDSDLFLIIVGTSVALGATAAYFKLESDKSYEKYLDTNNKTYLNKTDKYDLYSGIALGTLEVNFGFLIYKFLTD